MFHSPPTVIVDRRPECRALDDWAREAWEGRLRIVTVAGEPGVGKTALIDDFISRWTSAGVQIFGATCHEEVGVPFLPLVSALRGVSAFAGATATLERPDTALGGPDPALFVTLTDQLIHEATRGRVILRLDDVHWADAGTIDLLTHLLTATARHTALEPVTLLVLLATRPDITDTPAARMIDRLARESSHRSLDIGPLDELATTELLELLLGIPPSARLLGDVIGVTDGNPLFIRTLVRDLVQRGSVSVDGPVATATTEILGERVQLDEVIRRQMSRLSDDACHLLTVASLTAGGRDLQLLADATGWEATRLDRCLDEAENSGILVERPDGVIWFRHSQIRRLVAGDRSARQARSLHLQIAERLIERSDDTDDDRTIQIAHHLRRAVPRADPALVARFAGRAAGLSAQIGAWTKSARYAELALDKLPDADHTTPDQGAVDEAQLRYIAALSHFRNHDPQATEEHCEAAIAHARKVSDLESWGRALLLGERSRLTLRPESLSSGVDDSKLREYLALVGDRAPRVSAQCWQLLAEMAVLSGRPDTEAVSTSIRLARELDDKTLLAWASFGVGLTELVALQPDKALAALRDAEVAAIAGGDDWVLSPVMVRRALAFFVSGDLTAADACAAEVERHSRTTHNWSEHGLGTACAATVALAAGDLTRAERLALDALHLHSRASFPFIATIAWPTLVYVRSLRQDRLGAEQALRDWRDAGVRGATRFEYLAGVLAGDLQRLTGRLDPDNYSPAARHGPSLFGAGGLVVDVEIGSLAGRTDLLQDARRQLLELRDRGVEMLLPTGADVTRLIGMALLGEGEVDDGLEMLARRGPELALAGALVESLRCRVETCLAIARIDPTKAEDLAAELGTELDKASLLSFLHRLRTNLPAPIGSGLRPRRTVVAWDLVASTPLLMDAGDEGYVEVIHELNALIDRRLDNHRGVAFKYTGDGVYAWFFDRDEALRCAVEVRDDLQHRNQRSGSTPLILRTGIATGQPVDDAGDLFGVAVVVASRLCDRAGSEQIFSSLDDMHDVGSDLLSTPVGPMELKGIADPVEVVSIGG